MKSKESAQHTKTLPFAYAFLALIVLCILLSGIVKVSQIFLQSKFDPNHRFSLALYSPQEKKAVLLSFAPETHTVSVFSVSRLNSTSPTAIAATLKAPVEGYVNLASFGKDTRETLLHPDVDVSSALQSIMLRLPLLKTNLTIVDFARLFFFAKGVSAHEVQRREFVLPKKPSSITDGNIDTMLELLFTDSSLSADKQSIAIVNGTDIVGYGTRLARLISNMGGNVISVSSADNNILSSRILYSGENTYTLQKLAKILNFPILASKKQGIADITIEIGKNSATSQPF